MNKVYTRINWENYPSLVTPINEQNLNKLDFATDSLDNRIINLDTAKVNVTDIQQNIADWTMNEETGIITITRVNGDTITFDLNIEKIPIDFKLTSEGMLIMITDDGTQFKADIASMIPVLTFDNSNEINVTATGTGINKTYTFTIIDNSITEDKLEANYLANIKEETAKAQSASKTATDASAIATNKATIASTSATNAKTSETNAKTSETNAKTSETNASTSATSANASKTSASTSATQAKASENSAKASAIQSESYAHGQTNSRDDENIDNAKYYKEQAKTSETNAKTSETNAKTSEQEAQKYAEQAKEISESLSGALRPLGTISFADLPSTADASSGDMYNITDQFTTTADFKEGAGNVIPAGSNAYLTVDRYWDVLAGTPVTGVKGAKETYYRRGNVNITPANIGAVAEDGDISDTTVTFADTTTRENLISDEKVSVGFGKIKKWFADLKSFAFKDLVNNLTTSTTGSALDASQGKILNDKYDELNQSLENLILDKLYPVGSIYLETTNTNPASKLGGTWVEYGSSDAYLRLGGKGSGGSNSIKLVANQIPSLSGTSEEATLAWHSLCKNGNSADKNVSATETLLTDAYGGTEYRFWGANYNSTHSHTFSIRNTNQQSVSITPKYVAVYAWKRTA